MAEECPGNEKEMTGSISTILPIMFSGLGKRSSPCMAGKTFLMLLPALKAFRSLCIKRKVLYVCMK
jgi:hypothetical protein